MIDGFRAAWRGLKHFQHRGYVYIWANVFWAALTGLIITAPAAWAGLSRLSYTAHRQRLISLDDFWQGVRENLVRSIWIALANAAIVGITISNVVSYAGEEGMLFTLLRGIWLVTLVGWFVLQYFAWCFFYAMREPTFLGAMKNAGVMILQNPLFTVGILVSVLLIAVLSTLLTAAWFLITGSVLASVANSAVMDRLQIAGIEKRSPIDDREVVDPSLNDIY